MAAINDILIRTALAAVREDDHLRVYETDVQGGIREVQYDGQWTGGEPRNMIARGKIGTPVAATSIGLQHIRVYYVTPDNCLGEAAYDSGSGWYDGNLSAQKFDVAPESSVAAVFLGGQTTLRVYGQLPDNTIQEWVCKLQPTPLLQASDLNFLDTGEHGWTGGSNLGPALPGTQIAATTWGNSPLHIRYAYLLFSHTSTDTRHSVYAQDTSLNVFEKTWDGRGWHTGGLGFSNPIPRAALAVTSWGGDGEQLGIRLYYGAPDNVIREKAWDGGGGWYDGGFEAACIPASNVAAIPLGILRVYLQNGTEDTAVTEYMWSDGWRVGYPALPPA
jgi:hypothetical protein